MAEAGGSAEGRSRAADSVEVGALLPRARPGAATLPACGDRRLASTSAQKSEHKPHDTAMSPTVSRVGLGLGVLGATQVRDGCRGPAEMFKLPPGK